MPTPSFALIPARPVTDRYLPNVWLTAPLLVAESAPTTVVVPKMVVPPTVVVTVVNPFVVPLTAKAPADSSALSPVVVSIAFSPFLSFRLTALPADTVTRSPKSFPVFDSDIS